MTPDSSASVPPAPVNPRIAAVKEQVAQTLGVTNGFEVVGGVPTFRFASQEIHEACRKLRDAGFDYLICVTAVDYPDDHRFEVNYVLSNYTDAREVCLAADIDRHDPHIPTVSDLWETADWHEREVFDLFGIRFDGHPDLRRILLDDSWEGHPLRKDYVDPLHQMIKRPS